jgi:hypothetical protein
VLYHLSFNVRDPERVAGVLAEILGATVVAAPSPPFNQDALFVCCGDDRGTMISLEPWGVTYAPGPGARTDMPRQTESPAFNAFHGLFEARIDQDQITKIADREGWPSGLANNGPFEVINVWIEGTQLIEFTTPELLPAYLATFNHDGLPHLDADLRGLEVFLRSLAVPPAS